MTFSSLQQTRLTQNSIIFLHISNKHLETEVKNRIAFTITRKSKYLSTNLTKHVQYLYAEDSQTLMKETKEDLIKEIHTVSEDWKTKHSKDMESPQIGIS